MLRSEFSLVRKATSLFQRAVNRSGRQEPRRDLEAVAAVLRKSPLFNAKWYLVQYPDVAVGGMDPVDHYVYHGAAEGRNPSLEFDTSYYLDNNVDVAEAGINPLYHYVKYGMTEGRLCKSAGLVGLAGPLTIANKLEGKSATASSARKSEVKPASSFVVLAKPLVSIVIPAYSVENYIGECLDSLVRQTYRDIEIIIVDDGSTDGTYEVACAKASKDKRIKVFRQANSGPGAARNKAIAQSCGQYLTFADADDILPPTAIAKLVGTLERTGSDFVVGALARLRHGKVLPPDNWVKEVHAEVREGIRLVDFPDILKNVFVWNKMFKAEFFRQKVGLFPEGVLYEDQEPTALAYLHGTFDVLPDIIYHWRIREDGSSITQNKTDINDLRDRVTAKQRVSHIMAAADPEVYGTWLAKAMGFDLRPYFEQVPRTEVEFFDQLRECMLALAAQMTPQLWRKVRMIDRIPALAILSGYRNDVGVAIARREQYGYFVPGYLRNGAAYLDRRYLEGMQMSPEDELLELGPADLMLTAKATAMRWRGGRLQVEGFAHIMDVEFDDDFWIAAEISAEGREAIALEVDLREMSIVDREGGDAWNSHAKSGFVIELEPDAMGLDPDVAWRLYITVGSAGLNESFRTALREVDARAISDGKPGSAIIDGMRWVAGFEVGTGFVLRAHAVDSALATAVRIVGETVSITMECERESLLRLSCDTHGNPVEITGTRAYDGRTTFCCRLPEVLAGNAREQTWLVQLVDSISGQKQHVAFAGDTEALLSQSPEQGRVRASMDPTGELRLVQTCWRPVCEDFVVDAAAITFVGRLEVPGDAVLSARLVSSVQELAAENVDFDPMTQRFEIRLVFDPAILSHAQARNSEQEFLEDAQNIAEKSFSDFRPNLQHGFSLRLAVTWRGKTSEQWVKVGNGLREKMPVEQLGERYGVTCVATPKAALWITFRAPYKDEERGRYWQRRMHEALWGAGGKSNRTPEALEDAVLFESFGGKQISDSVLAICNEVARRKLSLKLYWTVADMGMPVPDGTEPLLINSVAWAEKLRNARYLVNNNNFPAYFRKSPGQVYLQTWHGTPLKRIGNDIPRTSLSLLYRQLMSREAGYWDYLVAQNDFAADVMPKAFGYEGEVLNLGYPRNDALVGPGAASRRSKVRQEFGFEPYHFVVLYAPTWRDNLSSANGYSRVEHLDFQRVCKTLGANARILMRGHHNTWRSAAGQHAGVVDVTHHPDINDLLLAADLLITDYSSVMFDYAVTCKPILFLAPDLEEYRDQTRGFYLDFENIAPGPVCYNNDEIIDVLLQLEATVDAYAERRRSFVAEFAPRDDGQAAARVVDAVWG